MILPPVWAALFVLGAIGLDALLPKVILVRSSVVGIGLMIVGLGQMFWAAALFGRARTTLKPHKMPSHLVVQGPFRYSRNPMYLGVVLVLLGLAFRVGTIPFFLVPAAFVLAVDRHVIPVEESNLRNAIGQPYEDYCRRVRRWI